MFNDITSLKSALRNVERNNRALRTLSGGNQALVRAVDESAMLHEMCRVAVEVGGYMMAWVGRAEDDEDKTVTPVARVGVDAAFLTDLAVTWADTERGRGPTGTAIRSGRPQVARNLQSDPRYRPWYALMRERGLDAAVSLPLIFEKTVYGALTIYDETNAFNDQELQVLHEMAEDLAYGIRSFRTRAEHAKTQAAIDRMTHHDALTGLLNRESLENRLDEILAQAAHQPDLCFALLLLDLHQVWDVNATLGFEAGDRLIKEVGYRLSRGLRSDETIARMRDAEFAIVVEGADGERAKHTALRLLELLDERLSVDTLTLDIRASAGIVLYPDHGVDARGLIRRAALALQDAMATSNALVLYSKEEDEKSQRRLALAQELHGAVENDGLAIHFQPKISIQPRQICGVEALLRWPHPEHGLIPPDEFIPLAERSGLIGSLTDWVINAALQQSAAWRNTGVELPVAVNVSARDLQDPQFVDKVETLLATWGVESSMLEFEVTETAIMDDPELALSTLNHLNALKIPLYVDDFGTGYSSLGYLAKLPITALKIDKTFVSDMLTDHDAATIVRSTITLAHDLALKVVAEGVEDEAVWNQLASYGCDIGQGYYVSWPLPADDLTNWLQETSWTLQ